MKVIHYSNSIVTISHFEFLKIFCFALFWGTWLLCKRILSKILTSSKFVWNEIENPPVCLIDNKFGQHSYTKIKLKGIKLHYIEAGDKSKATVVLLHGFPDCWIGWFNQISVLAQHFRVVALDLKGFGDSDKPLSRRAYRLEILLEELTIFISSLGITRCMIIGHDLGAILGWYLVHLNPELISKFVAISCPHPNIYWDNIPRSWKFNNNWIHLCQLPLLPELDALKNNLAIIDQCYQHLKEKSNCENVIEAYKYTFSRADDWTGAMNYFRNLPFNRLRRENLRAIDVRCLLLTGREDNSISLENMVLSTEYIQKYYLKIIDNAGHYPHQENPEMVNKALLEFLLDPPLLRLKNENNQNSSIIGKMMDSFSSGFKFSSGMLTSIKNDPNVAVAALLSKNYIGSKT